MNKQAHTNNFEAIDYLDRMHDSEQINQMATTTNTIVELCQQLTKAKVDQGNQIGILITKMDELTKIVEKLKQTKGTVTLKNGNKKCPLCKKGHKKGKCWENEKNAADSSTNWKSVKE